MNRKGWEISSIGGEMSDNKSSARITWVAKMSAKRFDRQSDLDVLLKQVLLLSQQFRLEMEIESFLTVRSFIGHEIEFVWLLACLFGSAQ